jgi:hypothetical protein
VIVLRCERDRLRPEGPKDGQESFLELDCGYATSRSIGQM